MISKATNDMNYEQMRNQTETDIESELKKKVNWKVCHETYAAFSSAFRFFVEDPVGLVLYTFTLFCTDGVEMAVLVAVAVAVAGVPVTAVEGMAVVAAVAVAAGGAVGAVNGAEVWTGGAATVFGYNSLIACWKTLIKKCVRDSILLYWECCSRDRNHISSNKKLDWNESKGHTFMKYSGVFTLGGS